jgi:hypothetical protein
LSVHLKSIALGREPFTNNVLRGTEI